MSLTVFLTAIGRCWNCPPAWEEFEPKASLHQWRWIQRLKSQFQLRHQPGRCVIPSTNSDPSWNERFLWWCIAVTSMPVEALEALCPFPSLLAIRSLKNISYLTQLWDLKQRFCYVRQYPFLWQLNDFLETSLKRYKTERMLTFFILSVGVKTKINLNENMNCSVEKKTTEKSYNRPLSSSPWLKAGAATIKTRVV